MILRLKFLLPALIVALGIILGTLVSKRMTHPSWLVMLGPLLLAGSIVLASDVDRRVHAANRTRVWVGAAVAGIFVATAAIICARNPASVVDVVPILGAGAVVVFGRSSTHRPCCSVES